MNTRLLAALAIVSSAAALTACKPANTPAAPAAEAAPVAAAAPAAPAPVVAAAPAAAPAVAPAAVGTPRELTVQGFTSPLPPTWSAAAPSSSMRVAQFAVPGPGVSEGGEVAVYFFPTGQGGSHDANIERWASQFTTIDGKPVQPQVVVRKSANTEVTLVELRGNYARGVGMGPAGEAKPNQTLMIALVETPVGRITMQIYGPSKTVAAHRDSFIRLATGFHSA